MQPFLRAALRSEPETIACIGAGPASLACAAELRQQGFQVTVIDKRALPGGLNTYGVAEYKLRAADSLREIEMIRGLGVEFRTRGDSRPDSSCCSRRGVRLHLSGCGVGRDAQTGHSGRRSCCGGRRTRIYRRYKTGEPLRDVDECRSDRRGQYGYRCCRCGEAARSGGE